MFKPKTIIYFSIFLTLLFCSWNLSAQKKNLIFENYSSEQGLSQNSVDAIAQDHYGFIWLGTENGLNRFNGYQITTYFHDINDKSSISSGDINDIVVDEYNRLWIATAGGLNCFDQELETFYSCISNNKDSCNISDNNINCVFIDSDHYLWVGTHNGLNRTTLPISKKMTFSQMAFKGFSSKLSNKYITHIFQDLEHNIWVGTQNGLNKLHKSNNVVSQFFPSIDSKTKENEITSINQDYKYRFWIGTKNGLFWFNEETNAFTDLKEHEYFRKNKAANQITHMLIDHSGRIFVSTYGGGLLLFSEKENQFYTYKNQPGNKLSLTRNFIYRLFEDQSKTLFVSVAGKGFCTSNLDTKKFEVFRKSTNNNNSLKSSIVRTVFCNDNKTIWIGLQKNGLDKFDISNNTFSHFDFHSLKQNNQETTVKSVCQEDSENLWLGTLEKGLVLFNTSSGFYKELKYSANETTSTIKKIFDMDKDLHGNLWIASFSDGLYKLNIEENQFSHYSKNKKDKNNIPSNKITSVYVDKKNRVWFTSWGRGLSMLDQLTGEIEHFRKESHSKNSMRSNFSTTIFEDKEGVFWIGTSVGLCRFDYNTKNFENYNRKDGIKSEFIYAIEENSNGDLWVSTNSGLSVFNKKTKTFINFDVKDGLQGNEFNIGSSCKMHDGRLLFGGINGFNIFHPDSIFLSTFSPKISINSFQLFNKEIKIKKEYNNQIVLSKSILNTDTIHLNYDNNFISFEFTAHDYSNTNTVQYAYILEGFEDEWNIVLGNKRIATYTNLDPGKYIFNVKSTNSDGVWGKDIKKIEIIIESPFWKTAWFIFILIFFIIFIFILIFRFLSKWIINQNKKLERLVGQRTITIERKNINLAEKIAETNSQKEELLAQAEQLKYLNSELEVLSTVATEMKNALTILDANGNLLLANKAFADIYTLTFKETKNKYGDNIFKIPFPEYILEIINRCFKEKVSVQFEMEYPLELTGKQLWVHSNMTPVLTKDGEIQNVIIIDSDITEVKQREIQVLKLAEKLQAKAEDLNLKNLELEDKNIQITEQSVELKSMTENLEITNKNLEGLVSKRTKDLEIAKEKAEKANKLKTVFLSNLSHEIRTPMNAICGFSTLMSDENVDLNSRKEYSNIINDNVDSLLLLVDNIMDLSKLQAKQIKLDNRPINVKSKLTEIYYMYIVDDLYIKENVKFELKIDGINQTVVKADEKRFKQIFSHLVDNAIKYTEKGNIVLSAEIENPENNRQLLKISVKDTGIGIKNEELNEIFEHFRTIDDKIKLYRGTGLGLAIVQELLKVYDWEIIVDSTLGKGSTFTIVIPL
ncbi:MAG: two-component regulator propeller domain-containing protein [Bacteroidota bacterium]